jgi:hypothetical protein
VLWRTSFAHKLSQAVLAAQEFRGARIEKVVRVVRRITP